MVRRRSIGVLMVAAVMVSAVTLLNTMDKMIHNPPAPQGRAWPEAAMGAGLAAGAGRPGRPNSQKLYRWAEEVEYWEEEESPLDLAEVEEEMAQRRRRLEGQCKEVLTEAQLQEEYNSREFLVSEKYRLVWCNIFKAASSTWMFNFLLMAGLTPEDLRTHQKGAVSSARELYPRPSPQELHRYLTAENYTSFLIVRDPFQRLVSAYRDKIEQDVPYYRDLRCKITRRYRERGGGGGRRPCQPSFQEFVQHVVGEAEAEAGARPDEHWAPYHSFCSPCQTHFQYILHFETLARDEAFLLHKVPGVGDVLRPKTVHSSHSDYTTLSGSYFAQLPFDLFLRLLNIYLPDFKIFGYSAGPYLDYVLSK